MKKLDLSELKKLQDEKREKASSRQQTACYQD